MIPTNYDIYNKEIKKISKELTAKAVSSFWQKEGKKMKIMISQPMRGKIQEQIELERKQLVEELEKQGHEVVNTIFAEESPKDCDAAIFYLAKSIEVIGKVDCLVKIMLTTCAPRT